MGVLEESGVLDILRTIDEALAVVGLSNPLYDPVMRAEFDPEPSIQRVTTIQQGVTGLDAGRSDFGTQQVPGAAWTGGGRGKMDSDRNDCLFPLEESITDGYLALLELILQVLDYIIDLLRIIVAIVVIVCTAILVIIAIAAAAAFFTGGLSLAAAAAAVAAALGSGVAAVLGVITVLGALAALVLWVLNALVEWAHEAVFKARDGGCLDAPKPVLPDWDPSIPAWPA